VLCEVCGRKITGKPYKAIIEKARLVVCGDCATLGSISWEWTPPRSVRPSAARGLPRRRPRAAAKSRSPQEPTVELVEDFGAAIRQAREARGLSHEDLGRKLNEKISVLKKLEGNKMTPDNKLVEKLEHALKIKLLVPKTERKFPKSLLATSLPPKAVTLGDMIKGDKAAAEDKK
jgi:putative transcription factor